MKVEALSLGVLLRTLGSFCWVDAKAQCICESASYRAVVNKYEFAALPPPGKYSNPGSFL